MSDLNRNAKPFVPSGKNFGPIVDNSNLSNLSNLSNSTSFIVEKNSDSSKNIINSNLNDLTMKLINEKHILIEKNNELESKIKRIITDKQHLTEKILNLEKEIKTLQFSLSKYEIENQNLDKQNKELNEKLNEVTSNFNKFKNNIWGVIKIKTERFETELTEKETFIVNLKSQIEQITGFYTKYVQILIAQISNLNQEKS